MNMYDGSRNDHSRKRPDHVYGKVEWYLYNVYIHKAYVIECNWYALKMFSHQKDAEKAFYIPMLCFRAIGWFITLLTCDDNHPQ